MSNCIDVSINTFSPHVSDNNKLLLTALKYEHAVAEQVNKVTLCSSAVPDLLIPM